MNATYILNTLNITGSLRKHLQDRFLKQMAEGVSHQLAVAQMLNALEYEGHDVTALKVMSKNFHA